MIGDIGRDDVTRFVPRAEYSHEIRVHTVHSETCLLHMCTYSLHVFHPFVFSAAEHQYFIIHRTVAQLPKNTLGQTAYDCNPAIA